MTKSDTQPRRPTRGPKARAMQDKLRRRTGGGLTPDLKPGAQKVAKGDPLLFTSKTPPGGLWAVVSRFDHIAYGRRLGAIRRGYPAVVVGETAQLFEVNKGDICKTLGVSSATLSRKVEKEDNLPADVSERLDRLYELAAAATRILGSKRNATEWVRTPNQALGNKAPIEMIGTGIEGDQVKAVLAAIEYGGAV